MTPALIYYGTSDALRREIGLAECYSAKWAIVPLGNNGEEFTPEQCKTKQDMIDILVEYRATYPSANFVFHN